MARLLRKSDGEKSRKEQVRLDRWLWAARFFKSRSLASEAAAGGHVRVGGRRAKPSHSVRIGDEIAITKGAFCSTVVVRGLSERRGPAAQAALLYEETAESLAARERARSEQRAAASQVVAPARKGRPSKRDRRRFDELSGRRR